MRGFSWLPVVLAALVLVLTPLAADARLGGGSSMGSRGSRTWSAPPPTNTSPYVAQPMQRSATPYAPPSPGYGAPSPGLGRPSFGSGLVGGLLTGGLIGMMFGGGLFGGFAGLGGFVGFLLQTMLIVMLVRFLFRRFLSAGPVPAGAGAYGRGPAVPPNGPAQGMPRPMGSGAGGPPRGPAVNITNADFQAFEQTLKAAQAAWTAHDLNMLSTLCTPEMVGYFREQIADQDRRGVRNSVTDVRLMQGDLSEAWAEQGREYATVAMKFSMIDVDRDASGRVIDGSPTEHVVATELWTFLRIPGGRWVLSAIQQSR